MYSTCPLLFAIFAVTVVGVYGAVEIADYNISFDCPPLPPLNRTARNVYELRPQDIKVVMAMGDSITAG